MSLKRNVIANYVGQAYTALVAIMMLPFYLQFLGAEAYGLVGFFTLLQTWLSLLTSGMSPTLARQVSHYRGVGAVNGSVFWKMLRSIELMVLTLAVVTALVIGLSSQWLASQWLTVKTLPQADVSYSIALMGVMVGMRWIVSLYTSGLSGMERQVWLNGFNILFSTLRYGVAYLLLRWVTNDPKHYFEFQLVLGMLELAVVVRKFYVCHPIKESGADPGISFSWSALREILPFAMGVTYTSMLWVFMTQSDKLILSHVLPLAQYGYFALVILIANGVLLFSAPISQAVLPRLTMLLSQKNEVAMLAMYSKATQFIVIAVATTSGMLALFPQQILFALTSNQQAAQWGAPVLTWFALGNGILVIAGMQYLLQYAHGKVRMHVVNTTISAAVQVPILAYVAFNYGPRDVAVAWFVIRTISFIILPAVVHYKFAPGLHWKWLGKDVLSPLVGVLLAFAMLDWLVTRNPNLLIDRTHVFITLSGAAFLTLLLGAWSADAVRSDLLKQFRKLKHVA